MDQMRKIVMFAGCGAGQVLITSVVGFLFLVPASLLFPGLYVLEHGRMPLSWVPGVFGEELARLLFVVLFARFGLLPLVFAGLCYSAYEFWDAYRIGAYAAGLSVWGPWLQWFLVIAGFGFHAAANTVLYHFRRKGVGWLLSSAVAVLLVHWLHNFIVHMPFPTAGPSTVDLVMLKVALLKAVVLVATLAIIGHALQAERRQA